MWLVARLRSIRALGCGLVVLLALVAGGVAGATPANAADSEIEFSVDGIIYTSAFPEVLFSDISRLVPGDQQVGAFWVRNAASSDGFLRVVLSDVDSIDPVLASALTLSARTESFLGDPVRLSAASPCWVLVEGDRIGPGESVKVTATLVLGNLDNSDGQNGSSAFSVRASISDASVGSLPPTSCGGTSSPAPAQPDPAKPVSGPPVVIAMTGSEILYPLLVIGAGALGVGLFLLIAARRRRQEDE